MTWQPGQLILEEYEVVEELGAGATAVAYRVRQVERGSEFAVKVPHARLVESADQRRTLSREVQFWISLPKHPHIVQCYFVRDVENVPVVFAEYVPSGTLGSWRRRGRIHGLAHVLDLGIQLAEAMSVAQRMAVVHRDLKPANCLMDASGLLKVGDFGVAAVLRGAALGRSEMQNAAKGTTEFAHGTKEYCSPEQFDGLPLDACTDVWSFAVTLFEVLTGRRPWLGPAARESVERYLGTSEAHVITKDFWDFLLAMLEKEPAKRMSSFHEISEGLRALYRKSIGSPYGRDFPSQPAAKKVADAKSPLVNRGKAVLARALTLAGRDPAEADRFVISSPIGERAQTREALAEIAILGEAARVYRELTSQIREERYTLELVSTLHLMAESQKRLGNLNAAISHYDEAVGQLREVLRKSKDQRVPLALAEAVHNCAVCHRQHGDPERAIACYDRALALLGAVNAPNLRTVISNTVAGLHQNRAMAHLKAKRLAEAIADCDRCVAMRETLAGRHGGSHYAIPLAGSYLNRGVVHRNLGHLPAAIQDYGRAIDFFRRSKTHGHTVAQDEGLSQAFLNRSVALMMSEDLSGAMSDSDEAVLLFERLVQDHGREDQIVGLSQAYNNRANVRRLRRDVTGALDDIDRCLQLREDAVERRGMADQGAGLASGWANKILFLMEAGDAAQAVSVGRHATRSLGALAQRKGGADLTVNLAKLRVLYGKARCETGDHGPGLKEMAAALAEYEPFLHLGSADVLDGFSEGLLTYAEAVDRAREAGEPWQPVVASLERLREVVRDGVRLPSAVTGRLKTVGHLLGLRQGSSAKAGCLDIRSMVRELTVDGST